MDPIPLTQISDLYVPLQTGRGPSIVIKPYRLPAEYSWWIGLNREELYVRSLLELPRMRTSMFSRPTERVIE